MSMLCLHLLFSRWEICGKNTIALRLAHFLMGREVQQKVKELVLERATCKYPSINRSLAQEILSKAWGQFVYNRNVWCQTFRKMARDPMALMDERCPDPRRLLELNSDALYRYTLEQEKAAQILTDAYRAGLKRLIPHDLSDDYVMSWIEQHNIDRLMQMNTPPVVLDESLNIHNLEAALTNGGIALRVVKRHNTSSFCFIPSEPPAAFNLQAPGKSDTRWSELIINDKTQRVKRSRTSLAIYSQVCPRICIFFLSSEITLLMFYQGQHGTTISTTRRSTRKSEADLKRRLPPPSPMLREIIPLETLKDLWVTLPGVQQLCNATNRVAYLLYKDENDCYLVFTDTNTNQVSEVSRWSLSTTASSLSCADEDIEKPEPDDFVAIIIKEDKAIAPDIPSESYHFAYEESAETLQSAPKRRRILEDEGSLLAWPSADEIHTVPQ
eukprot:Blabericola_migrator_1__7213@NODE_365_length_9399_cov_81_035255_g292_i0_p3_GENE_NODE_365_length_9399_cov_81_035255_g292_i0NODE_365_length_9399_cov_81_035255_g292_i0_p3_ORF_typecomplete_len441_score74_81_NODE_365_length_9399_cov_81_035255_g292_i016903012